MKKLSPLGLVIVFLLSLSSCSEEAEKITGAQTQTIGDQTTAEGYFNDAGDISTTAFNSPTANDISGRTGSGRVISVTVTGDNRFNGAVVTLETPANNPILNPEGTLTIDFGAGQTDSNGIVRKGKIILTYKGLRFVINSTTEVTFNGYEVNGVKLEGKRSVRNLSTISTTGLTFEVKDTGGKITFTDGTFITRESTQTHEWKFGAALSDYQWLVLGTASGATREKKSYSSLVKTTLVFKASCLLNKFVLPAQGVLILTVDAIPYTLDYGTGTCDNVINVSVAGFSKDVTVGG